MPTRTAELDRQLAIIQTEKEAGRLSEAAESAFFRVAHLLAEAAHVIADAPIESRNSRNTVANPVPIDVSVIGASSACL